MYLLNYSFLKLMESPRFIEIGSQCVWLSSSNKLGHEISLLQDPSIDTFWQYF